MPDVRYFITGDGRAAFCSAEQLAGATSGPADLFGLTDRGRIAPGLRADLVLMAASDLDAVLGSYDVSAIWKNGRAVDRIAPGRNATGRPQT